MSEPSPSARAATFVGALALVAVVGYLAAELWVGQGELGFPLDDSWIHLQFARNLAAGDGLSYNAGELVSGSTAPLWTALVALLMWLPGSPLAWVKLVGVGCHLASLWPLDRLARQLGLRGGARLLVQVLTLATGWLVWSALSGLEIPLFVLLSLWGISLHLDELRAGGAPRSLAVLALAALARPEGLLLLLLAGVDRLIAVERPAAGAERLRWRPRLARPLIVGIVVALAVLVPMAVFNLAVGGSTLPTTFVAKASGARRWLPDTGYIFTVVGILFRSQPFAVLLAGAGIVGLVERWGTARDRGLLPALWLCGLPLAYSVLSPVGGPVLAGNFGRYYFPLFPVVVLLGVAGMERLGAALGARLAVGPWRLPWRALLVVAVLLPTLSGLVQTSGRYAQSVANVGGSDVRVARWLASRLPPEAVLAVNDIGALKYFLPDNHILDLAGIAHPEIVRYRAEEGRAPGRARRSELRFLEETRPDFLVVFPEWFPGLLGPQHGFVPLFELKIPDNITMGGDSIVVASTPWTRFELDMTSGEETQ